jgi:hypothetical protein
MKKLKIGILVDNFRAPKYYIDLINLILKDKDIFEDVVIFNQNLDEYKHINQNILKRLFRKISKEGVLSIFQSLILRLIFFIETSQMNKNKIYKKYNSLNALEKSLRTINIFPDISPSGKIFSYNKESIKKISSEDCDLILRFSSGILQGKILTACKYGIISLHHGDNRFFRGLPAGFWEVFLNAPSTGFIIQKLNDELDGGDVLLRGNIMTASYWLLNAANIQIKSIHFVYTLLRYIALNHQLPAKEEICIYSEKIFRFPSVNYLIKYFFKIHVPAYTKKIIKILSTRNYENRWSVSYLKKNSINANLSKAHTIRFSQSGFLADPFVIERDDQAYCFVEEFSYKENKGKIVAYLLNDSEAKPLGTVLEEDFHLSFPYLVESNNNLYMIPESAENRDIRLYRNIIFPNVWELDTILIDDVDAADSIVFFKDNTWFLLTNICSSGLGDHQSELHLYTSTELDSDQWKPCKANPIIFDSLKARNGGFFTYNNKMYRVNQVHGKSHYGKSININEIIDITTEAYIEDKICSIEPNFFKQINSVHHFDVSKNFIVFDHSRLETIKK